MFCKFKALMLTGLTMTSPFAIVSLCFLCCINCVRSQGTGAIDGSARSIAQLIDNIERGDTSPGVQSDSLFHFSVDSPTRTFARNIPASFGSLPTQPITHHDAWMNSGLFQGDIAGIDPRYAFNNDKSGGLQFNAIRNRRLRWPNAVVPYEISNTFSAREKQVILRAMSTYRQKTCIKFVPKSSETDYLNFVKSYGCYSQVGRTGGRQDLSLGRGCLFHEIAVHEMMHALGFWHEHSRADRDGYIRIEWNNVIPGMRGQFDKISQAYQDFLGQSYDYTSVMHYDSKAFSKNGMNTILATNSQFTNVIGGAKDLSDKDLLKIKTLYNCPNSAVPTTNSINNGNGVGSRPRPKPQPVVVTPKPMQPTTRLPAPLPPPQKDCKDKFLDCPFFYRYCFKQSFQFIMKLYCPRTCNTCDGTTKKDIKKPLNSNVFHRTPFQRADTSRQQSSFFQRAFHSVFGS